MVAAAVFAILVAGGLFLLVKSDFFRATGRQDAAVPRDFPGSDTFVVEMALASGDISAVVDDVFCSIDEGAFEKLYESSTAPRFRQAASQDNFKAICERVQSRLGALKTKQSSRFDLNPVEGSLVASASYQARFEHGNLGYLIHSFFKLDDRYVASEKLVASKSIEEKVMA